MCPYASIDCTISGIIMLLFDFRRPVDYREKKTRYIFAAGLFINICCCKVCVRISAGRYRAWNLGIFLYFTMDFNNNIGSNCHYIHQKQKEKNKHIT